MLEVIEGDSAWASVVEGMTVRSPEQLKDMLEQAGFSNVEVYRKKPSYATIKGTRKWKNAWNGQQNKRMSMQSVIWNALSGKKHKEDPSNWTVTWVFSSRDYWTLFPILGVITCWKSAFIFLAFGRFCPKTVRVLYSKYLIIDLSCDITSSLFSWFSTSCLQRRRSFSLTSSFL